MNARCHLKTAYVDLHELGDFYFSEHDSHLFIVLPRPDVHSGQDICVLRIVKDPAALACPENRPRWLWDGNREAPTLTPSLHIPQAWHGWLKAGLLTDA